MSSFFNNFYSKFVLCGDTESSIAFVASSVDSFYAVQYSKKSSFLLCHFLLLLLPQPGDSWHCYQSLVFVSL